VGVESFSRSRLFLSASAYTAERADADGLRLRALRLLANARTMQGNEGDGRWPGTGWGRRAGYGRTAGSAAVV
jgi:hypothetical protein